MKKKIMILLLLAGLVLSGSGLSVCALASSRPDREDNSAEDEITETIVDNFSLLAQVPRPSHHEEKISAFLKDWAEQMGFPVRQDEALNITFDIPASEGMENYPLVALQGHMDMVVAVEDGKDFDPLQDPITVIRNDETATLTADGTSLGADDGGGLAVIMAVAQGKTTHGPVRVIITTDEEDGMEGPSACPPSGWKVYLILLTSTTNSPIRYWSAQPQVIP